MALYTTLASLSQTAGSNAADGAVDAPSTIDQQTNLLASFIAQLRDPPVFSANRVTSGQSITDVTFTEVVFNSDDYNPDAAYDTATGRFTPQVSGVYNVSTAISLTVSGGVTANFQILLYKNGALYKRGVVLAQPAAANPGTVSFGLSADVQLNGSTDYVSIFVYSDLSAGSQTVTFATGNNWFNGHLVRRM